MIRLGMKVKYVYKTVEVQGSERPYDVFRQVFEARGYRLIGYYQNCIVGKCLFHLVKQEK